MGAVGHVPSVYAFFTNYLATFTNLTPVISFSIYETIFAKTETVSISNVVSGFNKRTSKSDQDRFVDSAAGEIDKLCKKRGQYFPIRSEKLLVQLIIHFSNVFNLLINGCVSVTYSRQTRSRKICIYLRSCLAFVNI